MNVINLFNAVQYDIDKGENKPIMMVIWRPSIIPKCQGRWSFVEETRDLPFATIKDFMNPKTKRDIPRTMWNGLPPQPLEITQVGAYYDVKDLTTIREHTRLLNEFLIVLHDYVVNMVKFAFGVESCY